MKSKKSTITSALVNASPWILPRKNKRSNVVSPSDGKFLVEQVQSSKTKTILIVLKRQFYDQCILPTVTYGSETWNLTKQQTLKLRTMQRAHERIMLNITWQDHKTAQWIREKTKVRGIMETISKPKWNWAGHVARRTDNCWTTRFTFWAPRGHTRNRRRPRMRWRDDLDSFLKHWHRVAQNVVQGRSVGKACVQGWTFNG